mmetsp:Transcript_76995/g.229435  ORF Transcript_76995/g.229435 Transcript_76995/m.229435 type:complete len:239 (+) Transcript_76995:846-1562(+)
MTLPLVPLRGPSNTYTISPRFAHSSGCVSLPLTAWMSESSPTSASLETTCAMSAYTLTIQPRHGRESRVYLTPTPATSHGARSSAPMRDRGRSGCPKSALGDCETRREESSTAGLLAEPAALGSRGFRRFDGPWPCTDEASSVSECPTAGAAAAGAAAAGAAAAAVASPSVATSARGSPPGTGSSKLLRSCGASRAGRLSGPSRASEGEAGVKGVPGAALGVAGAMVRDGKRSDRGRS